MAPGTATVYGRVAPGFEPVAHEFERSFAERGELGAAFAAFVDGEPVVDLWGGTADRERSTPWREDTLTSVYSGSKGLVAACLLVLLDRGALALDAPVCRYWPEFDARGKQDVLVRHLVSHQAGLPGLETPISTEETTDDVRIAALLAQQRPLAPPGTRLWYHALTFGWLCGELIRRADGRSVGRLLREEIADPLGLDVWIGLPPRHEHRVARLVRDDGYTAPVLDPDGDRVAWSIWANPPRHAGRSLVANDPRWHAAEIPATSGIVSARSFARLYGCLARGGELDGVRLVAPSTVELGRRPLARGHEPYLDSPQAFGVGFQLQTDRLMFGPPLDAFGHAGTGGSVHGAWPGLRTGFSYAMNLLRDRAADDRRAGALLTALHGAVLAHRAAPAG